MFFAKQKKPHHGSPNTNQHRGVTSNDTPTLLYAMQYLLALSSQILLVANDNDALIVAG